MRKNKLLISLSIICLIATGLLNRGLAFDQDSEYVYRNRNLGIELTAPPIDADDNAWYSRYSVIAHSGGGTDGYRYTNSKEAWLNSYEMGDRVFDADLSFTSDKRIVLRHEWSDDLGQDFVGIPTYEKFMSTPIFGYLTPMSLEMMIEFMAEHDDIYVAVDFKDGVELIRSMVAVFIDSNNEALLAHIIISFYDYDDLEAIRSIYGFQNYAIRQYENLPHNYQELTAFCLKNRIPVCMIKLNYIEMDDISILLDNGIKVFAAIINTEGELETVREQGASGIVSDFIYEPL